MPAHKHVQRAEILALRARGYSQPHIARTLGIHVQTVKYHLRADKAAPEAVTRRCPVCQGVERLDQPHQHEEAA